MNMKMKTLSMAVLGLVGFAATGVAMAQCPTIAPATPAPWTAMSVLSGNGISIAPGYDGTSCALRVALNQSSSPAAKAFVLDGTPANETRYRAQFIVDASGITLTAANRTAVILNVLGGTAPAGGTANMAQVVLRGTGSAPGLRIFAGDTTQPSKYQQVDVVLPNPTGANRVEIDLTTGANASMRYWVSNISTVTTDGAPTGTLSALNNTAWTGVDQIFLGLATASTFYRQNFTNTSYVFVDQFDSRRQTFIGKP